MLLRFLIALTLCALFIAIPSIIGYLLFRDDSNLDNDFASWIMRWSIGLVALGAIGLVGMGLFTVGVWVITGHTI